MCFRIRISRCFHLATQIISIQNPNFPKKRKNMQRRHDFWNAFPTFGMLFQNGCGYHHLLQYHVLTGLRVLNSDKHNRLWWHQDGATVHATDGKMLNMDRQFEGRVISRTTVQNSCPRKRFFTFLDNLDSERI